MNFTKTLGIAILGLLSVEAFAQTEPFYKIEVVNQGSYDYAYGPYATVLSEGANPKAGSILLKNNMFSYFNIGPHEYDFGVRTKRFLDCGDVLSSFVCGAFWDTGSGRLGYHWFEDILNKNDQLKFVVDSNVHEEKDIIYTQIAEDGVSGVGYRTDEHYKDKFNRREVYGIAKFNNKTFILKSPVNYTYDGVNIGGYATALTYVTLDDGRILVGGYGSFDYLHKEQWIYYCYEPSVEIDQYTNYGYCPGFKMQATAWLIDPNNDADGATIIGKQASNYIDLDADEDALAYAAIQKLVKFGDKYIGVGYSPTEEFGISFNTYTTIASFFVLNVNGNEITFDNAIREYNNVERPGRGDDLHYFTYAQSVNKNGQVVLNCKYDKSANSNKPMIFGISKINADLTTTPVHYPLYDNPIRGANSQGEDINDNNFVVGWRDARGEIGPVNNGSPRDSEGFLYDANTNKTYYLNDTICHLNDDSSTNCSQNGKYYTITWAVKINNENVVLASGYEYPSYDAFINRFDAKAVTMKLIPNEKAFVTDEATGAVSINQASDSPCPMVTYDRKKGSPADEGRGGDFGIFGLMLVLGFGLTRTLKSKRN